MPIPFHDEVLALMHRVGASRDDVAVFEELMLRAAAIPPSTQSTITWEDRPSGRTAAAPRRRRNAAPSLYDDRYQDLEPLGAGGMGEVFRVHDRQLNRTVARKVIKKELTARTEIVERFVQEAKTTAQLQHPSIVAVHDIGQFPDGRSWFTMKEVRGDTLTLLIRTVHAASRRGVWEQSGDGATFRQLMHVFHEVCMAMAYAHHRGIVHRDLKPDNVMVGRYGEVQVMDWGIAKVLDPTVTEPLAAPGNKATQDGRVIGTPAYMCPEQAWAHPLLTPHADVYSLGAMLYEILTGRPPYVAEPRDIVRMLRQGVPVPAPGRTSARLRFTETRSFTVGELALPDEDAGQDQPPPAPAELVAICMQALSYDPEERQDDALVLAEQVKGWLEGAERQLRATELVREAATLLPQAGELRKEAQRLSDSARSVLEALAPWVSDELKAPHWKAEDRAEELSQEADLVELDVEGMLRAALSQAPGLPDAHLALACHHRAQHREAEGAGDRRAAAALLVRLGAHSTALPEDHPQRNELLAYVEGDGFLTIATSKPAEARLFRVVPSGRRALPVYTDKLTLPQLRRKLAMGHYTLSIETEGQEPITYPFVIARQGAWSAAHPDRLHEVLQLPEPGELSPADRFVAAGPYSDGQGTPWCEAFVMRRNPVTLGEYLVFLNDMAAKGREEEALRHMPQEQHGGVTGVAFTGNGSFTLLPDPDGDLWDDDWPVLMVSWADARAYAAWEAQRTGQPWRLPWEAEWRKAARGIEGRTFPWGDFGDPSWLCMSKSSPTGAAPAKVSQFPDDESVYGVRHLAGNVLEWCLDAAGPPDTVTAVSQRTVQDADQRILCGGSWTRKMSRCDTLQRTVLRADARMPDVGFRLVRSLVPPLPPGSPDE